MQKRRRNLTPLHLGQPNNSPSNHLHNTHQRARLARRVDEPGFGDAGLDFPLGFRGEVQDCGFAFALLIHPSK